MHQRFYVKKNGSGQNCTYEILSGQHVVDAGGEVALGPYVQQWKITQYGDIYT